MWITDLNSASHNDGVRRVFGTLAGSVKPQLTDVQESLYVRFGRRHEGLVVVTNIAPALRNERQVHKVYLEPNLGRQLSARECKPRS